MIDLLLCVILVIYWAIITPSVKFKDVCGCHETTKPHRKIKLNTVLLRIYHTLPETQYLDRIILGIDKSTFRSKGNSRLPAYKRGKYQACQLARPETDAESTPKNPE